MNRESVVTNMEVLDADAVKAANNTSFFSSRRTPGEDDEQEDPVQGLRDDVARGLDDGWSQWSRTVLVCSTPE